MIVRKSLTGKSFLIRQGKLENLGAKNNPEDTVAVKIGAGLNLDTLFYRAERGDEMAAYRLAELLRNACSRLSDLSKSRPKLFHKVATRSWRWPAMMSLHPLLCDDYKTVFKTLKLGADVPLELHSSARWVWDDAADMAFALLSYLWTARSENRHKLFDYGAFGKAMDRLPKFTSDSASQWWYVAKEVLLFSYPEPQEVPELAALVKAPSKRRSPGRIKQAILALLKARFIGFAPPNLPK